MITGTRVTQLFRRCFARAIALVIVSALLPLATPVLASNFEDGARYAFLGSKSLRKIYVIDLIDHKQVGAIDMTVGPTSVQASEMLKALVVGHSEKDYLTLIDLSSEQLNQYQYPLDITPDEILISPVGESVALFDSKRKILQVHALKRKETLLSLENVEKDSEFTFQFDGSAIYWVNNASGSLHKIDLWSEQSEIILTNKHANLSALTRSTDGTLGFISDKNNDLVYVVDLKGFKPINKIRTGRAPDRPWGTADGQFMMVPNSDGSVTTISTYGGASIYTVTGAENPVSVNSGWLDTRAAIVGSSGYVNVINILDGTAIAEFNLSSTALQGVVTSDSKLLVVPLPQLGKLSLIDLQKMTQLPSIDNLPSDIGPVSLAISNNLCH